MSFKFCKECNNLLYPKYEEESFVLVCKRCRISQKSNEEEIYQKQNISKPMHKNKMHFIKDVTLPKLSKTCKKCNNDKCVSYMEKSDIKALNTFYICTSCLHEWNDD